MKKQHLIVFLLHTVVACTSLPVQTERYATATNLAHQQGWLQQSIDTDAFTLQAFLPAQPSKADTLTIYFEGDGQAWVNSNTPSDDPTPMDPLALKLALLDPNPSAYLARPCQYVSANTAKNCAQRYWTSHRYSPEVIQANQQAINQIKQIFGAQKLILVGYSGGGTVATLAAASRHDVIKLVTVAGNLNPVRWATQRHLSPLSGSLNPADAWMDLQHISQRHYVGGQDFIISEDIAQSYASQFTINKPSITVVPDFNHHCCWESLWPSIVNSDFGDLSAIQKLSDIQPINKPQKN